jgi:hypothetical protein
MEREFPAPVSPEGEEHPPKYTIEKITRTDGTTAEEVIAEDEGIPFTTRLFIIPPKGKKRNLLDFTPRDTIVFSAERALAAVDKTPYGLRSPLESFVPALEKSLKEGVPLVETITLQTERVVVVAYPNLNFLKEPGRVLAVLHELGHVKKKEDQEFLERKRNIRERILAKSVATTQEEAGTHEGTTAVPIARLCEFGIITSYGRQFLTGLSEKQDADQQRVFLPNKLVREAFQLVAENERYAWAFALNTIRKLRKGGEDLEPALDLDKIREIVYGSLRTYEAHSPTPEELFVKGRPWGFSELVPQDWIDEEREVVEKLILKTKDPALREELIAVRDRIPTTTVIIGKNVFRELKEAAVRGGKASEPAN